jgi:hypothetical protein
MIVAIRKLLKRKIRTSVLSASGWERRTLSDHSGRVSQWRDPVSGLWYPEETAARVFKKQALDQVAGHDGKEGNFSLYL